MSKCKGFCRLVDRKRAGYTGQKYCANCEKFFRVPEHFIHCWCCGVQLRTGSADKRLPVKRKNLKTL